MVADEGRLEREELEEALRRGPEAIAALVEAAHAADLVERMEELPLEDKGRVLAALAPPAVAELLRFADDGLRAELLARLDASELAAVVEEMPADEVVDLLALTDDGKAESVLRRVDFERARDLRELARYGAQTAGGLMTPEFVSVPEDARVGDAIKEVKAEEGPGGEEEIGVFVVDDERRPVGYVSDRELLTTPIHTPIRDVMRSDPPSVHAEEDQEQVAQLVRRYSLSALPVVDDAGVLIGVVSADDAHGVLEEEVEEDLLRLVGTSPVEQTRLPVLARVRARLPLQALTVLGGLATAAILDLALPASAHTPAGDVLRYLPIIIGLAGNVGIQSSTVLVRAFATGELSQEREASVVRAEVLVALVIGILCGVATAVVTALLERHGSTGPLLGPAIGGAICVAVTWAGLLGCLMPMLCQRSGLDPAIAAGPFLIVLSDVSGASIFVGVTHLFLDLGA
jgi:magnesium transporter